MLGDGDDGIVAVAGDVNVGGGDVRILSQLDPYMTTKA